MKKIKQFLKKCYNSVRLIIGRLFMLFPIKKNRIYFISNFGNKYNCHPRAYFEYLYNNHKSEFDFVYIANNEKTKSMLPKDVKTAKYRSLKDYYYYYTSAIIINNFRSSYVYKKRKKQYYVQVWHGDPFTYKKVENDVPNLDFSYVRDAKYDSKKADLMMAGSKSKYDLIKNSFWYDKDISNFGTPRYDRIMKFTKVDETKYRRELGFNDNDYIVLYAPTFRQNTDIKETFLDHKKIIDELSKSLNRPVKFIYRFHPNIEKQTKDIDFGDNTYNMTSYPDIIDIMMASDVLISDFSGCMFDMMLLNKLCVILSKDYKAYISKERGTYLTKEQLPFAFFETENDALRYLKRFNANEFDDYINKVKDFKEECQLSECGHACEKLYEYINKKTKMLWNDHN